MQIPQILLNFVTNFQKTFPAASRVISVALKHFELIQGVFFLSYGAKELIGDGIIANHNITHLNANPSPAAAIIHKIRTIMAGCNLIHGPLYIVSAVASILSELHKLNIINVGFIAPVLNPVSNILFVGACALSIGHQIHLLTIAKDLEAAGDANTAKHLRVSSILGIIGNVGYIVAVGLIFFGAPLPLGILIGCLALTIGIVKFFYDCRNLKLGQ